METFNQQIIKANQIKDNKRNILQRKKEKSIIMKHRQSISIMAIVITLCQPGSHALIQSRGRLDTFGVASILQSTMKQAGVGVGVGVGVVPSSPTLTTTISMIDKSSPKAKSSSTILHYRNYRVTDGGYSPSKRKPSRQSPEHHKNHGDHHISSFFHSLWNSGKSRRAREQHALQMKKEQEKQYVLDDYLESIDRRYKRLHEEKKDSSSSSASSQNRGNQGVGGFTSALQWLTHTQGELASEAEEMRKHEDAIYVLGLADLASTRLLQRHQLPVPKSKLNKSVVIDIDFKTDSVEYSMNDPTSEMSSSSLISTETINDGTVALTKAVLVLQFLKKMKIGSIKKYIEESTKKANQIMIEVLRSTGKGLTQGLGSFCTFIGSTSGLKQSLQVLSIMFVTVLTLALSLIRPLTKA